MHVEVADAADCAVKLEGWKPTASRSVSRLLADLNQILCMASGSLRGKVGSVGSMAFRNHRAAALPAKLSRSWLLVNAAKEETFAPSLACEADSVIFDMEAAVPDDQKKSKLATTWFVPCPTA